jgi:hypothetical protein
VAVLAMPLAWVAYSLNWIRERHRAYPAAYASYSDLVGPIRQSPGPAGLWLFGEHRVSVVFWNARIHGEMGYGRDDVQWLFPEAVVELDLETELELKERQP